MHSTRFFKRLAKLPGPKEKTLDSPGWLYLDTIEAMNLLTGDKELVIALEHLDDFCKLDGVFEKHGERIAGIVTEFPTNPLLHSCNLERVKELCLKSNALLVIDPTMASPKNTKVSGLADAVVNSLTKYAGCEGDAMMGSLAFPRSSSLGRELFDKRPSSYALLSCGIFSGWPSRYQTTKTLSSKPINP